MAASYAFLTYFQLLGYAALSGTALHTWISQGGLGGGLGKDGGHSGTAVTLNRCDPLCV